MQKIEHLGIAVKDLAAAEETYSKLFKSPPYKRESVEREGVNTSFFRVGASKIELLEATKPDSAIAKFIEKRGEGLHHVAFEVIDIRAEMARLKSEGFTVLSDEPMDGADDKLVAFVHPKDGHGLLIELCQSKPQGANS